MLRLGDKTLLTGAAFVAAVEQLGAVEIAHRPDLHDFAYTFRSSDWTAVVLLKISTAAKRWQFTFSADELFAIEK